MTTEELRAEAEKLGYSIIEKNKKKCKECIYLDMSDKHTIGYVCKNPMKHFRTRTAKYKYASTPCCTRFTERKEKA